MSGTSRVISQEDINTATATAISDLGNVSGALAVSAANNRVFLAVLTGNVTAFTLATNSPKYASAMIALTQGGSGSFTVAFPTNFRWQGGFSPALSTAPGATDILQCFTFDGGVTWFAAIVLQAAP